VNEDNPGRDSGFHSDQPNSRGAGIERRPDRLSKMEELYRKLEPELRRTKPNPEAIAAALEAAQRLAMESDTEVASDAVAQELPGDTEACPTCGYRNRAGNKFCGMCGMATQGGHDAKTEHFPSPDHGDEFQFPGNPFVRGPQIEAPEAVPSRSAAVETHHYHHHYHHHYFPAGYDATGQRSGEPGRGDAPREDKFRPNPALRGDLNRAEAGVRRITQEWVLACNTKHLDDLLELYVADAMVLRSNYPAVRGVAAVREFFFSALEAGLGEVELEPLRVEVTGDLAYEAGRCKALVPSATGKRREERGKYLWVCARQSNGEWKLTADCWSSDLSLGILESDVPASAGVKTNHPKKG
jgi:ketosteroid isomerase-like protein